eukprot:155727_1
MAQSAVQIISSLIQQFDVDAVLCICGTEYQMVMKDSTNSTLIYGGGGINGCDKCWTEYDEAEEGTIFWHCPNEYNIVHPNGYDVCNNCRMVEDTEDSNNMDELSNEYLEVTPVTAVCEFKEDKECHALQHFVTIMKQYNQIDLAITEKMAI